jgi:hypothetical protein
MSVQLICPTVTPDRMKNKRLGQLREKTNVDSRIAYVKRIDSSDLDQTPNRSTVRRDCERIEQRRREAHQQPQSIRPHILNCTEYKTLDQIELYRSE